ncbi:hypothetical protein [Streptomyces herbicida]|uniref:hypothetical protein n=1 Tax=Streptomyces herbicida TaxID=3065675 RepID=UPI00292D662A|nr:hypothetical protein [Streptomyces sp. NEAU-HV9]
MHVGGAGMSVTWAATALESGRFSAVERCSDVRELADHFKELRSRGQGYLEVRLPGSEFPLLANAVVEVPLMDDLAAFSGDFVLNVDRAWALVHNFIQMGAPGELGCNPGTIAN